MKKQHVFTTAELGAFKDEDLVKHVHKVQSHANGLQRQTAAAQREVDKARKELHRRTGSVKL